MHNYNLLRKKGHRPTNPTTLWYMLEETNEQERERERERERTLTEKIAYLQTCPQPVQRSPEWYLFRYNLITASNAWMALKSNASRNQLIREKCAPLPTSFTTTTPTSLPNTDSPLHWGQKYEPVSTLLYAHRYGVSISDLGCLPHPVHSFLAASPDGIVTAPTTSERYGRLLEIKNVVSREITGEPKFEYFVQIQLQLEVCDLDECDFLETKFEEYTSYEELLADKQRDPTLQVGMWVSYVTPQSTLVYRYLPVTISLPEQHKDMIAWRKQQQQECCDTLGYRFAQLGYWKLVRWSCVLIPRDRAWFHTHVPQWASLWETVIYERVHGYEHRMPTRRSNKQSIPPSSLFEGSCARWY